jgi:hypothetical protein
MKFMGLITGIVIAVAACAFVWKAPAKYKDGSTWFYFGAVVGGSYLLLARPFK